MTLFDKPIDCNECGQQFTVDDSRLGSLRNGDLEVQYFSCPACGTKYCTHIHEAKRIYYKGRA